MIKSRGLNHININVSNLKRSVEFYERAFGLEVRFKAGRSMVFMGSPGADDIISLCHAEKGAPMGNGGVSHFGFAMGDEFDKAVAQIEGAGGQLIERGQHAPGHPFAFFKDPDGYVIEIGN